MKSNWITMLLLLVVAFAAVTGAGLMMPASAQVAVDAGGWRYNDGYWNYWDPTDKAYYYTDGRHWYTYGDNDAWSVYNFDRGFGKAYVREGYSSPKANVTLPNHRIKVRVR